MMHEPLTKEWMKVLVGVLLGAGLLIQCHDALSERAAPSVAQRSDGVRLNPLTPDKPYALLSDKMPPLQQPTLEQLATADPVRFFEMMVDHYDRSVRDYTCVFAKQELVCGKMTEKQVMKTHFREDPFSVRFKWIENRDKASRVLYVQDEWIQDGQQMAVVEPKPIARLFVPYVMRPIHGADAMKTSRRTIDQFGFRKNTEMILKHCRLARAQGILDFTYKGARVVDGRPTLLFERHLPYTGEQDPWPDRVLEVHVDRQWLVPILCVAFADEAKRELLGHYVYSDVKFNISLPNSTFTRQGMGLR